MASPFPLRSPLPHVSAHYAPLPIQVARDEGPIATADAALPRSAEVERPYPRRLHEARRAEDDYETCPDVLHLECGCQRTTNPDIEQRLARAVAIYGVAV